MLSIEIANEQDVLPAINAQQLNQAAANVLREAGITAGAVSIAIVDDAEIHRLNKQFLAHDFPTDVLSFVLDRVGERLEGEVIASAQTAVRAAGEYGWQPADELLLYVIHGTLHLVGYDDLDAEAREAMRAAERRHLAAFDLVPRGIDEQPPLP